MKVSQQVAQKFGKPVKCELDAAQLKAFCAFLVEKESFVDTGKGQQSPVEGKKNDPWLAWHFTTKTGKVVAIYSSNKEGRYTITGIGCEPSELIEKA